MYQYVNRSIVQMTILITLPKKKERTQYYTITNAIERDEIKLTSVDVVCHPLYVLDIVIYISNGI